MPPAEVVNYVALFSDIGALKQAEERALHWRTMTC